MFRLSHVAAACLMSLSGVTRAAYDIGYGTDDDLFSYVTRPELRPPRFNVTKYYPDEITPGYWFVAPYANILQETFAKRFVQPCQGGPAIYDGDGELVWSGACMTNNQNTCDFRMFMANGSNYLSAILTFYRGVDNIGHAIVLDDSMEIVERYRTPTTLVPFNMHEFKVIEDGRKALHIVQKTELADVSDVKSTQMSAGLLTNMGIREFDLQTDETTFEWWVHNEIPYNHSNVPVTRLNGPYPESWDWLHLNAIDKNDDGDYLVTARYTDAIYKVSGKDKSLMWSVGGGSNSFVLDGFNVSGPHDGRFIRQEGKKEYISFLDNGGDERRKMAEHSTGYLLELDKSKEPWTARVVKKWARPDGKRSEKRGNFQLLDNGNAFGAWSDNCYMSEHSPDGRVLMEAQFASERFVSYRSYKFNFTSWPEELPVMKGFVYGDKPESSMSVYYVSWNGATDVAAYDFYNAETDELIGKKLKHGFETMYSQNRLFADFVYVEAVAEDGSIMGRSNTVVVERPKDWPAAPELPDALDGDEDVIGVAENVIDPEKKEDSWNKEEL